jgi:hypothetical protein
MVEETLLGIEHGADLLALSAPGAGPDVFELVHKKLFVRKVRVLVHVFNEAVPR